MRLPSHTELCMSVDSWFQSVIGQLPPHMVDTTLLVAWRAWYARNKVSVGQSYTDRSSDMC
jgi:hypothetical protein